MAEIGGGKIYLKIKEEKGKRTLKEKQDETFSANKPIFQHDAGIK